MARMRVFMVFVLAMTAGGALAFGTYNYMQRLPAKNSSIPTRPVVVAASDLDIGAELRREDIRIIDWPANAVPANSMSDPKDVIGRGLVLPVIENEPFLPMKLAAKDAGAGLPPVIPPGLRAVSVRVNEVIGVAGYVLPGTRVDVLATASPTGNGTDMTSKVILTNVQVLAAGTKIDRETDKNKPMPVSVVTMLVNPEEAERLTLASTEGKIQLALRNPLDKTIPATPGVRPSALFGFGAATRTAVARNHVVSAGPSSAVRDAARTFVNSFDAAHDRLALLTFSDGARVIDPMPASRGFDKTTMINDVPSTLPGGSTAMVEGLYRAWDELRSVPTGSQSGLRVIVLFTDGASNSVPGDYGSGPGVGLRTYDFPQNPGDTFGQTWNSPHITGLYDTQTGANTLGIDTIVPWDSTNTPFTANNAWPKYMPLASAHTHHRSAGIPTSFPLQTTSLNVDGVPQSSTRGLRDFNVAAGKYPAEVHNINNAARNLVEIIANAARNDTGDYKIRIYTIGMGQLVPLLLGTRPESSESILKRMANDGTSPDFNSSQLEGKYYYAQTAADVGPAFQALQNQILRLTK